MKERERERERKKERKRERERKKEYMFVCRQDVYFYIYKMSIYIFFTV